MAMNLKDLRKVRGTQPPRVLLYGEPGIGKTTLAAEFPDAVFLQVEDGTPGDLELTSFGKIESFGDFMERLSQLYTEPHDLRTVVVDSVTELQRLVWTETCARGDDKGNAKKQIEDFGYGKGYVYALRVWQEVIDGLNALRRDRGMSVILIAHAKVDRFDDPETQSYSRYEIDLHKTGVGMIERDMDAILFLKTPVSVKVEDQGFNKERAIAQGSRQVMIHTAGRPAYVAKNRYGMPEKIPYAKGTGFDTLAKYLPIAPAETPATTETKPRKKAA